MLTRSCTSCKAVNCKDIAQKDCSHGREKLFSPLFPAVTRTHRISLFPLVSQNIKDATVIPSPAMFETCTGSRCALSYLLGIQLPQDKVSPDACTSNPCSLGIQSNNAEEYYIFQTCVRAATLAKSVSRHIPEEQGAF